VRTLFCNFYLEPVLDGVDQEEVHVEEVFVAALRAAPLRRRLGGTIY
jgi:hypothetical protein